MIIVGLDDTDSHESRGTGHLARQVAGQLSARHTVLGVTRHQLLIDPRVPCTKNNSCAAILLDGSERIDQVALLEQVKALMLDDFVPGSDPGLCVAESVPQGAVDFGRLVQRELVTQAAARHVAREHGLVLVGLGGDQDGVIGALAAVALAATGEDGRYVLVGGSRELAGLQTVSAIVGAGIDAVQTSDGQPVVEGLVLTDKLRPARRGGRPIAVVERAGDYWLPLKLD